MKMTKHVNLIVIGGGSGGLAAAKKAASYGATVILIEMGRLGGTCVNVGCVPKKIMWYSGEIAEALQMAPAYGFQQQDLTLDFKELVTRRENYIHKLNQLYEKQLDQNNVDTIKGAASFLDSHTVSINQDSYTADHIIIATGCCPDQPILKGAEFSINSDGFFALQQQPKHIAIIGAGYIAVELACVLNQLGSKVKLLVRYDKPLRHFDPIISDTLLDIITSKGIQVLPHHHASEITRDARGQLTLHCMENDDITGLDTVLFAIGRHPRTQMLNLFAAGVNTDKIGFIPTDKWETTNVPHIYAIGDITGKKLLTPVAIAAGRQLATRLFGGEKNACLDYHHIPTVVFSHPPIGSVGLTEQEAVEIYDRDELIIYHTQFNSMFYALGEHKVPSKMKLITLKDTGKILGCHVIGLGSDEMLQGFSVAIKMGATKKDFDATVAIHPTNAEEVVLMK